MPRVGHMETNKSITATRRDIADSMRKWNVKTWDLLTGRASATLTYEVRGRPQTLDCQRFETAEQNARAIFGLVDALRLADQRGMMRELAEQAAALLEAPSRKRPAHEILGIFASSPLSVAEAAYKALAHERHPDKGGTDAEMKDLNEAIETYRKEHAA